MLPVCGEPFLGAREPGFANHVIVLYCSWKRFHLVTPLKDFLLVAKRFVFSLLAQMGEIDVRESMETDSVAEWSRACGTQRTERTAAFSSRQCDPPGPSSNCTRPTVRQTGSRAKKHREQRTSPMSLK